MIRFNYNSRVFEICFENYVISSAYQELRNELGHVYGHEALCRIKKMALKCRHISSLSIWNLVHLLKGQS